MMRRVVLVVVIVAVALTISLVSRTGERSAGGEEAVLRGAAVDESVPTFATDGGPAQIAVPDDRSAQAIEPASLSDETSLRLTVLHADGVPAAGCVVVAAPSVGEPWRALTDAAGRASGPALASDGEAWVNGAMPGAWSFPLTTRHGAATLTLPAGEVVEGSILVDGAPPTVPFAIDIDPRRDSPTPTPAVAALLQRPELGLGVESGTCGQLIDASGTFRFSGLPTGWAGFFALNALVVEEDDQSLDVSAPAHGVLLRLRRVPLMHMRVLLPSGMPAAAAKVAVGVVGTGGEDGYGDVTDQDGCATFPLYRWSDTRTVDVSIVAADDSARLDLSRQVTDPKHDLDFGDLHLAAAWTVVFRALDPRGTPIAGALGATECVELRTSALTGDDGLGRVTGVPLGCGLLRVAAARCSTTDVPLPSPPPAEPIDVVLSPCASIDVQLVFADGAPRPGLTVHTFTVIEGGWSNSEFDQQARLLGTTRSPWSSHSSTHDEADGVLRAEIGRDYPVPESGLVAIGCFRPGDPIEMQLVDRTRHALWRRDSFTLQPGQQECIRIDVADVPSTVDVLVTDAAGAPLAQAGVRVLATEPVSKMEAGRVDYVMTDAAGRARVEEVYAPEVLLECAHERYATARVTATPAAGLAHVVLGRGLSVTAHFVDEQGRPVPVQEVRVKRADEGPLRQQPQRLDSDLGALPCADWRLDDLPDLPLIVNAWISGHKFEWAHDPKVAEARFTLPVMGSLIVRGLGTASGGRLRAESTANAKERIYGWLEPEATTDLFRWPVVLPGRYRIVLEQRDENDVSNVVRGPIEVEVKAGEETTALLP